MHATEQELARAAASLKPEDLQYLRHHNMIPGPDTPATTHVDAERMGNFRRPSNIEILPHTQSQADTTRARKRRHVDHEWPEVGEILGADYGGIHCEAEVIPMPRYKAGKAVRILTGPRAGTLCRSLTGAMLKATEEQREEGGLRKKGVANGWDFWKVQKGGN